jgi:hypothetical protein
MVFAVGRRSFAAFARLGISISIYFFLGERDDASSSSTNRE